MYLYLTERSAQRETISTSMFHDTLVDIMSVMRSRIRLDFDACAGTYIDDGVVRAVRVASWAAAEAQRRVVMA